MIKRFVQGSRNVSEVFLGHDRWEKCIFHLKKITTIMIASSGHKDNVLFIISRDVSITSFFPKHKNAFKRNIRHKLLKCTLYTSSEEDNLKLLYLKGCLRM